jgi:predicted SAM-dependent methyltransferase
LKLHLGCGQRYLAGYVNIDFPPSEHSVQEQSVADLHADLLTIRYPFGDIEEVRLHHVFEHFSRPVACALLASWNSWLGKSGVIHIEVPDFTRTARAILSPLSSLKKKAVAERHLFGSHEAHWAVHCEGYTTGLLEAMLKSAGFKVEKVRKNAWRGTYNFEIIATKIRALETRQDLEHNCQAFLGNFLVDDSEQKLLEVWMDMYRAQVERSWALDA